MPQAIFKRFRNLDENNDWCFGNGFQDYADQQQSCMLNIRTRLQSFKWDCFFDLEAGIDWFALLGQRGADVYDVIEINVRTLILQSLYVKEIVDLDIVENRDTRTISIAYTVNTIFDEYIEDTISIGGTYNG